MSKVCIGKIVNTHGIKGEVKIISDFDKKNLAFKKDNKVIINDNIYTINSYRVHKNFDMITFKEFNNINDVLDFKNQKIYINREDLDLKELDYILDDLIDMDVKIQDEIIGKVIDYSNDINPLLKVQSSKIFYIPIKADYILEVDLKHKTIYVKDETRGLIL